MLLYIFVWIYVVVKIFCPFSAQEMRDSKTGSLHCIEHFLAFINTLSLSEHVWYHGDDTKNIMYVHS